MKKLALCLFTLISALSINAQSIKYTPSQHCSIKKDWLQNFVLNNAEGINVLCEGVQNNEYGQLYDFVVLSKGNNAIVLFNKLDSSYIISMRSVPKLKAGEDYVSVYQKIISEHNPSEIVALNSKSFFLERKKM